jgi:hypothetical protein
VQVDSSIEATFQNFPIQHPPAEVISIKAPQDASESEPPGGYVGQNLLDFDDDGVVEQPATAPSAAPDASTAAENDWADFSGADSISNAVSASIATPIPASSNLLAGALPVPNAPSPSGTANCPVPPDPFGDIAPVPLAASTLWSKVDQVAASAPSPEPKPPQASSRLPLAADDFAEPLPAPAPIAPPLAPTPPPMPSAVPAQAHSGIAFEGFDPFRTTASNAPATNGHAPGLGSGAAVLKGGALKDERDPFADLL